MKKVILLLSTVMTVIALSACCTIDDDLSDCGTDLEITYELRLVTNMSTELQSRLGGVGEEALHDALRQRLSSVFSDYGRDLELNFYETGGSDALLHHESHVMNAPEQTYSFYLPQEEYHHTAVANAGETPEVSLSGTDRAGSSVLREQKSSPHTYGLFSAKEQIDARSGEAQRLHVTLGIVNCAAALVIDKRGHEPKAMEVTAGGFASAYNVSDGTYVFSSRDAAHSVETVTGSGIEQLCYLTVNFPSRDTGTRTVVESTEPFESGESSEPLWQWEVHVTKADGSVTATTLSVHRPLRAGQLMIIKAYMDDDGAIRTGDTSVGVNVTLNWSDGGEHNVDL